MTIVGLIFGIAFVVAGIVFIASSSGIGEDVDKDVSRTLPRFLADLVREAPFGLDMRKRVLAVGVGFILFGILFAAVDPLLS